MDISNVWMDFEIKSDDKEGGMLEILEKLKPSWKRDKIFFKDISNVSCCNRIFFCYPMDDGAPKDVIPEDTVVFRLCYMTIDSRLPRRSQRMHSLIESQGMAAKVLCHFTNGTCMQYIHGKKLDSTKAEQLKDDYTLDRVMRGLAKFHSREMLSLAKDHHIHENLVGQYHETREQLIYALNVMKLSDRYQGIFPSTAELEKEQEFLSRQALKLNPEMALCQLDFSPQNMFLMDNGEITFIDFDWAAISYVPFDISSILLWFTDFTDPKVDDLPNDDYIHKFCALYLNHRREFDPETEASEERISLLVKQIKVYEMMSWLRWTHVGQLLIAYCGGDEHVLKMSEFFWNLYKERRDSTLREVGVDPNN